MSLLTDRRLRVLKLPLLISARRGSDRYGSSTVIAKDNDEFRLSIGR